MIAPVAPPPDVPATKPDPIDPAAVRAIDFLDGETISSVWRTSRGFLILTNLRVLSVWHQPAVLDLGHHGWRMGLTFFLFDLDTPRVIADRFVEVGSVREDDPSASRFQVADPAGVAEAIAAGILLGRTNWQARRAKVTARLNALGSSSAAPAKETVREIVRVIVRVPCPYCGSLMDETALRCPVCGAPRSPARS